MTTDHSADVFGECAARFARTGVVRPMRVERYEPGQTLVYEAHTLQPSPRRVPLTLQVERFVGGGYAGQVYRVVVRDAADVRLPNLQQGCTLALKLLVPPSGAARLFRDTLYAVGFQGAFQLQCNPAAARAGALWQKLIRAGAAERFGDTGAVNDIHATVVDSTLGCCGELSDWVEGRTWRLEVDDRLDFLALWRRGRALGPDTVGSPEYRAKREFMAAFVELLHEMGAHEFARQYEWWTCKSQPNCLKRAGTDAQPGKGLVAVDFRAGLTLLPFLPMSPGDVLLILQGITRGSLVQFDRGDTRTLKRFVESHPTAFAGMEQTLVELEEAEGVYRNSVADITHNGLRLLYSPRLWRTMHHSAIDGWRIRGLLDENGERRLRGRALSTAVFSLLGLLPLLGRVLRKAWCHDTWRSHYWRALRSPRYLLATLAARRAETALRWYRAGRVDEYGARAVADSPLRFAAHLPCGILPPALHRILTDPRELRQRLYSITVRPVRLYFDGALREQWLRDMVAEGKRKHIVTDEDAETILSSLGESFIQKYLKSLAVHVCTLPVTQVVSVAIAAWYLLTHPEVPRTQAWTVAAGIIALFQVVPVSPGSFVRGLYVLYLVIRERNVRDYGIALSLGFFKYVGYLSFPIQMTYRYPALARFMAGHWATDAVHVVPVFGEHGALLERWAFDVFYNWPLTIRRRVRERVARRSHQQQRRYHAPLLAAGTTLVLSGANWGLYALSGVAPGLEHTGILLASLTFVTGALATLMAGGTPLASRIAQAASTGLAAGVLSSALSLALFVFRFGAVATSYAAATDACWRGFIGAVLAVIGAVVAELLLPDPAVGALARTAPKR